MWCVYGSGIMSSIGNTISAEADLIHSQNRSITAELKLASIKHSGKHIRSCVGDATTEAVREEHLAHAD